MAAFNFPNSPSTNDTHTENGVTFKWNGTVWKRQNASYTDATNLNVTGISTFGGVSTFTGDATFSGNVAIGKTLTYEDVKNVDSVGIITARAGIVAQSDVKFANQSIDNAVNWGKVSNILQVRDGTKITFGNANDMQLSHNGSDSVISQSASGTGNLKILSGGAQSIECVQAGAVNIAHNGNTKLATTSTGVDVTGIVQCNEFKLLDNEHAKFGTSEDLRIYHNGSNGYIKNSTGQQLYRSATHTFENVAGSTEYLRINSSGRVNIGQASDTDHTLCVAGTDDTTSLTGGHNQGIQLQNKSTTDGTYSQIEWRTSSGGRYARIAGIQDDANGNGGQLVFLTETSGGTTTERLRIASDGKWTIKNVSGMALDLQSSAGTGNIWLEFSDTDGTRKGYFGYGSSGSEKVYWVQQKAANMSMYSNGSDRFEVQSDGTKIVKNGRLTINSTFIDFSGSISTPSTAAAIFRPADNTLAFSTANTERLRIASDGRLLIGTQKSYSSQGYYDDITINNSNTASGSAGGTGISLISGNNTWGAILFGDSDDDDVGAIKYAHNGDFMRFNTAGGIRFRIDADGVKFNGDTASQNALDDYEEGSWTPTLYAWNGTQNQSYDTQTGNYVKIGNQVFANFWVDLSSKGTVSGNYTFIGGLPYNHAGTCAGTLVTWGWAANGNIGWIAGDVSSTATVVWLSYHDNSNNNTGYMPASQLYDNSQVKGTIIYRSA